MMAEDLEFPFVELSREIDIQLALDAALHRGATNDSLGDVVTGLVQ
jgi:hypothetical protein